MIDWLERERP